ncbi:MAG: carbamoyl-phosphate synthase large subunit [Nanoarchaeota archaeon]|nr:carbamoyl-phosphate synthase large subunit [Nanoarchaeota archaeon]MBU1004983.1 carbamoyl-phosphate synthase large subunit [Nanoarchaeota archaeon]MBU1946250.1 carbamoyl-phosphate synthase large subunit [Nanoarchaeota archaeon]
MPKRTDIKKILVIGSGPIVIGQAAEFDYSGTQACKALREEGYKVVLVNSNPATIMTDPDMADAIYIEPLNPETVAEIIRKEKPDGLLGTMGGQTGLNLAVKLSKMGILEEYNVKVLGTSIASIEEGEDRELFKNLMKRIGEPIPESQTVTTVEQAKEFVKKIGLPAVIRPAYTLGGTGGGIAFTDEELEDITQQGINLSPINQVLIEKAILGINEWGEFELEVMRDKNDNCIIICPMENFDPMGIHTGESIVTAPTQTLNDHDFQVLRTSAIKVIRALKVEGGCNIQFGLNYKTGEYRIIEVNPRVSRSSALASKATGYPIARIAAKIAIGMTLDEIPNDVTKETKACFEPTIDYVVVKIPRWPFDKFSTADKRIGTQMKSTGETMAIGRTFEEALQKAIRSLEVGRFGLGHDPKDKISNNKEEIIQNLKVATHKRLMYIRDAIKIGITPSEIHKLTGINQWFLEKIKNIYELGNTIKFTKESITEAKRNGFSDIQIAGITKKTEEDIRNFRKENSILPTYKMVDTCAAEFKAYTPYLYSTYESEDESNPTDNDKKVIIVGGGPIRIGQGIEFDYACVHSVFALREMGYEALIINNNPETVSTDFDTSDKLYFEPLTYEDVLNIIERENPKGVILQFGGQTPINMAMKLQKAGVNILGTQPEAIDTAENRNKFGAILDKLKIPSAEWGTAFSYEESLKIASRITYPILVRPSYVLGGRAMQIVDNDEELDSYMKEAVNVSPEHPVLIDKYLGNAIELDVDALCDGKEVFVAAIMEHIEEAGVHSGDSACVIPPQNISQEIKDRVIDYTKKLALALNTIGLINMQMAVKDDAVYILEANPRASRTVPYVSKSVGIPLAKMATKLMLGKTLDDLGLKEYKEPKFVSVKEVVFPFLKLKGVDPVLGPEMKSTGEVMGIDENFDKAFYKAQAAAGSELPSNGNIIMAIGRERHKIEAVPIAKELIEMGFKLYCTKGTSEVFKKNGIRSIKVPKLRDDSLLLEMMKNNGIQLVINLHRGSHAKSDSAIIRRTCVEQGIPYITRMSSAKASVKAIKALINNKISVNSLEEYYTKYN